MSANMNAPSMNTNKLVARAKAILLTPKTEWPVIAAEPDTVGGLYMRYIVFLAAIPPIARFISFSLIGTSVPLLGHFRLPIGWGLESAVVSYLLSLVGAYVVAVIIDALAPTFHGEKNQVQALKTVAYSYTSYWVISIIGIVPGLGLIAGLAALIYGIYLLRLGLPATMKCPDSDAWGYTAVTIIVAVVVFFVLGLLVSAVTGGYGLRGAMGGFGPHGVGAFSGGNAGFESGSAGAALQNYTQRLQAASQSMQAAQSSGNSGAQAAAMGQMMSAALGGGAKVEALPPDRLKQFVPDALGGLKRTSINVERNAAMGIQISTATAQYSDGAGQSLNLVITDTASLKGIVGFASGWAGVEQDRETDTGYDKTYKNGGRLVHEQWDNRNHSGKYALIVGDRFSVEVSGSAADVAALKGAVGSIDLSGLESLRNAGVQSN
jgi:hypothetical protein